MTRKPGASLSRWTWCLLAAVLALGCSTSKYRVERDNLDCEEANGEVQRTLTNLSYEITRFDPAAAGTVGEVDAKKETPDGLRYGTVRITCADKIVFQPVEGSWFLPRFDFSRDVYYALLASAQSAAIRAGAAAEGGSSAAGSVPKKPARGTLRVVMRPYDRFETRKATGVDLDRRGLLVVRVEIQNGTSRPYQLHAERIVLVDEEAERTGSLGRAELTRQLKASAAAPADPNERPLPPIDVPAVVEALEKARLRSGRVAGGETRAGLLYFPEGEYRSGRLRLIDVETGEVEGTIVAF